MQYGSGGWLAFHLLTITSSLFDVFFPLPARLVVDSKRSWSVIHDSDLPDSGLLAVYPLDLIRSYPTEAAISSLTPNHSIIHTRIHDDTMVQRTVCTRKPCFTLEAFHTLPGNPLEVLLFVANRSFSSALCCDPCGCCCWGCCCCRCYHSRRNSVWR